MRSRSFLLNHEWMLLNTTTRSVLIPVHSCHSWFAPRMKKVLLRNARDRRRFIGKRGWIQGERRARQFSSIHEAIVFAIEHELWDSDVLVRFGEANTADVAINIPREVASSSHEGEDWPALACVGA